MDQRPYYDYSAAQPRAEVVLSAAALNQEFDDLLALADQQRQQQQLGVLGTSFTFYAAFDTGGPFQTTEAALTKQKEAQALRASADKRALDLLQEHIGAPAVAAIQAGGGYPVPSKLWPEVVYLVPPGTHARIKVMDNGVVVTESCLVGDVLTLPWPDLMLQRIRAIELDETIVFSTGVACVVGNPRPSWRERLLSAIRLGKK